MAERVLEAFIYYESAEYISPGTLLWRAPTSRVQTTKDTVLWIIKSYGLRIVGYIKTSKQSLVYYTLSGSNYTEEVIKLKMIVFVNFHHKRVMHLTIILCRSFLRNELLSNPRYTNKENQNLFPSLKCFIWGVFLTAMAARECPLSQCFNFQRLRSSSRSLNVSNICQLS